MGARLGKREILLGALPHSYPPAPVEAKTGPAVTVLMIIPGNQVSLDLSALDDLDPGGDIILMMELMEESTYVGCGFKRSLQHPIDTG